MAMNRQRRTSNINNIVTYDTLGNVTIPASFTVKGLMTAGLARVDANGLFSVDTTVYQAALPSQSGNSGKYLTTNGSTLSWGTVSTANIYNSDGTLAGNRTLTTGAYTLSLGGFIFGSDGTTGNTNYITRNIGTTIALANSSTGGGSAILAGTNASPISRVMAMGNGDIWMLPSTGVIIGGTTNAGYKLDVQGTARVSGGLTINSGSTLNWNNVLTAQNRILFYDDGNAASRTGIGQNAAADLVNFCYNGKNIFFAMGNDATNVTTSNASAYFDAGRRLNLNYNLLIPTGTKILMNAGAYGAIYSAANIGMVIEPFDVAAVRPFIVYQNTGGSVGIGDNSAGAINSAQLFLNSTTKGFLPPRMTTTQKNAIVSPVAGLQVYDSTLNLSSYYNGTSWLDYGVNIYNSNGTLSSNRTVTIADYSLTLSKTQTALTGANDFVGTNIVSAPTTNASISWTASKGFFNYQGIFSPTFGGDITFQNSNYVGQELKINRITFASASSTVTMTQSSGIRAFSNAILHNYIDGTNNGTITHFATLAMYGDFAFSTGRFNFTNRYGLLINDFQEYGQGHTYTNRWAIYQAGASDNNFFAGKVGIGSGYVPSTYQLDVNGTARVSGNFEIDRVRIQNNGKFWYNNIWGERWAINLAGDGDMSFTCTKGSQSIIFRGESTYTHLVASTNLTSSIFFGKFEGREGFIAASQNANNGDYTAFNPRICGGFTASLTQMATNVNGTTLFISPANGGGSGFRGDVVIQTVDNSTYTANQTHQLVNRWFIKGSTGILSNISTPNASSIFDITSTTQGFLPPRMTTTQKNAIATPAAGLVLFDTTLVKLCVYNGASWETITSV